MAIIFCSFILHLIGGETITIPETSLVFTVLRERLQTKVILCITKVAQYAVALIAL